MNLVASSTPSHYPPPLTQPHLSPFPTPPPLSLLPSPLLPSPLLPSPLPPLTERAHGVLLLLEEDQRRAHLKKHTKTTQTESHSDEQGHLQATGGHP